MKRYHIRLGVLLLVVTVVAVALWGFRAWQDTSTGANVPPIVKSVSSVTVKSVKIPPPPLFPDAK
jgi:hypothetical protein